MYQIDASAKEAGVIYLDDWTFEPNLEIAFDALRWRPIVGTGGSGGSAGSGDQVISNITPRAKELFRKGQSMGLRANAFSKMPEWARAGIRGALVGGGTAAGIDELTTGQTIGDGTVLRLRCFSQKFEFLLGPASVGDWKLALPPHRMSEA